MKKILILLFILIVIVSSNSAQVRRMMSGEIHFYADDSVVHFSNNIIGLIFDGALNKENQNGFPKWRYLGGLKIDSLIYADSIIAFNDSTLVNDFAIHSDSLVSIFERGHVIRLERSFSTAKKSDTLYWDSIRNKRYILPDLTDSYWIDVHGCINDDLVFNWLLNLPEIKLVLVNPEIIRDEISE